MKTYPIIHLFSTITFLLVSFFGTGQAVNLGMAANFTLFTVTGAMGNTAVSSITGNIGANTGAISGFGIVNGGIYSNDAITRQCSTDLIAAYNQLYNITPTSTSHTPAFGGGETLFAGVYSIAAAGSVAGIINLDAQGNPGAVFIFKFGGAFTTGASSTINLINGASSCNIYWIANGAIAMAAGTIMKGTLIANNGAVSMGDGGTLEGRMLSTTGAVSVYGVYAYNSCGFLILPVALQSFFAYCEGQKVQLEWSISPDSGISLFTVEHKIAGEGWQEVQKVSSECCSLSSHLYNCIDLHPGTGITFYRLKQTDADGKIKYSNVKTVNSCENNLSLDWKLSPNPSNGKFSLAIPVETQGAVTSVQLFNSAGEQLYQWRGYQQYFDLSANPDGIYFIIVHQYSKIIVRKIILAK